MEKRQFSKTKHTDESFLRSKTTILNSYVRSQQYWTERTYRSFLTFETEDIEDFWQIFCRFCSVFSTRGWTDGTSKLPAVKQFIQNRMKWWNKIKTVNDLRNLDNIVFFCISNFFSTILFFKKIANKGKMQGCSGIFCCSGKSNVFFYPSFC